MRIVSIILAGAGLFTVANNNSNANLTRLDQPVPLKRSFDPKTPRPPVIQIEKDVPVQAADAPRKDQKTQLIETLDTQINKSLPMAIAGNKLEIKSQLEILQTSGSNFLKSVKNGGDRKKEIRFLDEMDRMAELLLENKEFLGRRLVLGIRETVGQLQTISQLEVPPKKD